MKIFRVDFEPNTDEEYSSHIEDVRRFYDYVRSSKEPIVLVSSEKVFGKKRWGGYKETDTPNPTTNSGLFYLGLEAIAIIFDHVKIVRGETGTGIELMRFANRFSEMPKILHIAQKPTILNTNKAKKLGIL